MRTERHHNLFIYGWFNPRLCLCKPSTTYPVHLMEPAHTMQTALCMLQHPTQP